MEGTESGNEIEIMDEMIRQYEPVVDRVLYSIIGGNAFWRDGQSLRQVGMMAMWKAIESHKPETGVPLGAWINLKVRGGILDELRKQDALSRFHRKMVKAGEMEYPAIVYLDKNHNENEEDRNVHEVLEGEVERPDDQFIKSEECGEALVQLKELKGNHRRFIELHFLGNRKMKDIGDESGLTESRVSQVISQGLKILKSRMLFKENALKF